MSVSIRFITNISPELFTSILLQTQAVPKGAVTIGVAKPKPMFRAASSPEEKTTHRETPGKLSLIVSLLFLHNSYYVKIFCTDFSLNDFICLVSHEVKESHYPEEVPSPRLPTPPPSPPPSSSSSEVSLIEGLSYYLQQDYNF